MFHLATYTFISVLLGIVIALVSVLIVVFIAPMLGNNRKFTAFSCIIIAILFCVFIITDISFCGLVSTKNTLEQIEQSSKYRMAQQTVDYAANLHPILADVASVLMEDTIISPEQLKMQKEEINKSLWILGIIKFVLLILGIAIMPQAMQRKSSAHQYHREYSKNRISRDHERVSRTHRR